MHAPFVFPNEARGSASSRPIMVLLDALGERWTLRILWELRDGPQTFRLLEDRCGGISPTVLNVRLKHLRRLEIVEHVAGCGYQLTSHGRGLTEHLLPLNRWAEGWARAVRSKEGKGKPAKA